MYSEYAEFDTIEKIAEHIIKKKVGTYATTKTQLYQWAIGLVCNNAFHNNLPFSNAWSEKADAVVSYIINNDKCIVPILDR